MAEDGGKEKGGADRTSRNGLLRDSIFLAAGALLTLAVQWIGQNNASAVQVATDRNNRAVALYSQYEGMGAEARSATQYVDGVGGDPGDLLKMYRHFREVSTLVMNDEVNGSKLAGLYQGRLVFWGNKFVEASGKLGSSSDGLSSENLFMMNAVGTYLLLLYDQSRATSMDRRANGSALARLREAMKDTERKIAGSVADADSSPSAKDDVDYADEAM